MSLVQELDVISSENLRTGDINDASRNHDVAEIAQFIRSSEDFTDFFIDCPPFNEEFGRHISDAIVQNSHIRKLDFCRGPSEIRDTVAWIASRNTLVNMTSLESVAVVDLHDDMSELDCSALFSLLLTSTSLRKFEIRIGFNNGCTDDVMSALLSYLGAASLTRFEFFSKRLSEAAFTALCDGVALSTVRHFTLRQYHFQELNLETGAESLARMIVESSLEEVTIAGFVSTWSESLIPALKRTAPVRNMDFAFTQIGNDTYETHLRDFAFTQIGNDHFETHLRINRKWKPLVFGANTPLALWPHILEKSHASPETSHGSADICFYVLRQKPELVPAP